MTQEFDAQFKNAWEKIAATPHETLLVDIMRVIRQKERIQEQRTAAILAVLLFLATAGTVETFRLLWLQLSESGVATLSSLLFSDFGTIMTRWQDFSFSILESLPVFNIIASLMGLLAVAVLIRAVIVRLKDFSHQAIYNA